MPGSQGREGLCPIPRILDEPNYLVQMGVTAKDSERRQSRTRTGPGFQKSLEGVQTAPGSRTIQS